MWGLGFEAPQGPQQLTPAMKKIYIHIGVYIYICMYVYIHIHINAPPHGSSVVGFKPLKAQVALQANPLKTRFVNGPS